MKILVVALAALLLQWPQFRGPDGLGTSDATGLPLTWGEGKNVRWKTAVHGRAWSSPVILGNQVWVTTATPEGRELFVVALDKHTGKTVWRTPRSVDYQDLGPDGKPQAEGDFRKAFATPHIVMANGEPILVSIGSKATYGYDPMTGKELWRLEERSSFS